MNGSEVNNPHGGHRVVVKDTFVLGITLLGKQKVTALQMPHTVGFTPHLNKSALELECMSLKFEQKKWIEERSCAQLCHCSY
jgi:hypothetical protein